MDNIRIGVAGHTNVGKTTLISTLTRSNAGAIADKANVTQKNTDVKYTLKENNKDKHESLFATFVDLPGFQNISVIKYLLKEYKNLEGVENELVNNNEYKLDLEAIRGIKKCHVIIYVVSLMDIPKQVYEDEINLIKQLKPNVICILNQYINAYKALNKHGVDNRKSQWEEIFKKFQCEYISLDAHWDSPAKVDNLYMRIENNLYEKERKEFLKGLKKFKDVHNGLKQQACEKLFQAIQPIYNTHFKTVSFKQKDYNHYDYERKTQAELETSVNNMLQNFSKEVSHIYSIASASPTASLNDIKNQVDRKVNYEKRDEFVKAEGRTVGIMGAFAVGAWGLVIELFTGGATSGQAISTGAKIGYNIFSKWGESTAKNEYDGAEDTINLTIDKNIISSIVFLGLATIWGVSQVGYATQSEDDSRSKRELSRTEIAYLAGLIKDYNTFSFESLKWQSPTDIQKTEIINCFKYLLHSLEKKEDIYDLNFVITVLGVNPVQSLPWKKVENTHQESKNEPKALRDTREALLKLRQQGEDI
jgi:GTPase Era involved in 16S rRNA processing